MKSELKEYDEIKKKIRNPDKTEEYKMNLYCIKMFDVHKKQQ